VRACELHCVYLSLHFGRKRRAELSATSPDGADSRGAFTGVIVVAGASARLAAKQNKTFLCHCPPPSLTTWVSTPQALLEPRI